MVDLAMVPDLSGIQIRMLFVVLVKWRRQYGDLMPFTVRVRAALFTVHL